MTGEVKAGRFEIEREVGRGGMGCVFRARDTRLGRTVALKLLPPEATGGEWGKRLAHEARTASGLSHPGIATVYDFIEDAAGSFIVFEFIEGVTLREWLGRGRPSTDRVLDLGVQLAQALAAAHEHGITHRDLKPANIMLARDPGGPERVKVLDFGLAKVRRSQTLVGADEETATLMTTPGALLGTIDYMAPEQLESSEVDGRADIYAVGLILYEMCTGRNPFAGKTPASTIANILTLDPPALPEREAVFPAELERIIRKCLRKRPDERYQSARELAVDLANLRHDLARSPSSSGSGTVVARTGGDAPWILPRPVARGLMVVTQVGYLATYTYYLYRFQDLAAIPDPIVNETMWQALVLLALFLAICGFPVRVFLLFAVSVDYEDLGRKFRRLFPGMLVLDLAWTLLPLVFWRMGLPLIVLCSALLATLPFQQRRWVYSAWSASGGRRKA